MANTPIDTLPLFVRSGSIIPLGSDIESIKQKQAVRKLMIFPGADTLFALYDDDGTTYAYEQGKGETTTLAWNDRTQQLSQNGDSFRTDLCSK